MTIQKVSQIFGLFKAGEDIFLKIRTTTPNIDINSMTHLGIETLVGKIVIINNKKFEIGKTGHLEFDEEEVKSLSFYEDTEAIIDFTYM